MGAVAALDLCTYGRGEPLDVAAYQEAVRDWNARAIAAEKASQREPLRRIS